MCRRAWGLHTRCVYCAELVTSRRAAQRNCLFVTLAKQFNNNQSVIILLLANVQSSSNFLFSNKQQRTTDTIYQIFMRMF